MKLDELEKRLRRLERHFYLGVTPTERLEVEMSLRNEENERKPELTESESKKLFEQAFTMLGDNGEKGHTGGDKKE